MKKILLFLSCIFSGVAVYGQQEHTLHFMNDLGQFNYTNPAFTSNYKVTLGLPGLSSNYLGLGTGFSYNDLITKQSDGKLFVDLNRLVGELEAENQFKTDLQTDLFFLTFQASPRLFLSLNVSAKSYHSVMYPGDLFDFLVNGNGHRLGETLEFSPLVNSTTYLEFGAGAAYKVNHKLTLGTRVKVLRGVYDATTEYSNLQLTTHADSYDLTAQAAVSVRTSNLHRMDEDDAEVEDIMEYMDNQGMAVDLGATYQVNERFGLAVSVLDIGYIEWTEDTHEYFLDPEVANYTFSGAAVNELLEDGSAPFDAISEEIETNFEFEDRATESYRSRLPLKTYISGRYDLTPTITAGGLIFLQNYEDNWDDGYSLNIAKEFGKILSASLSYSAMNDTYNNIGGGLSLNLAPFQLYLVSDNLMNAAYSGITKGEVNDFINNAESLNLRFGLNFVFGRQKTSVSQLPN